MTKIDISTTVIVDITPVTKEIYTMQKKICVQQRRSFLSALMASFAGLLIFGDKKTSEPIDTKTVPTTVQNDSDYVIVNNWFLKKDDVSSE